MKKQFLSLLIGAVAAVGLAGLVACSSQTEARVAEVKLPTAQCGMCVKTISTAVKKVDGVQDVQIDLDSKTARVTFRADKATVAKNEQAVVKSGYAANDKKASDVIISEIMSNKFRWVNPETEIEDAIQKMLNNNIRRLIILDDDKLVGVLTQTDLTEFLRNKLLVDQTVKNIQKTS